MGDNGPRGGLRKALMGRNAPAWYGASTQAQAILEFTFAMMVAVLLLMGMIQVIAWTGKDLAQRRLSHEQTLVNDVDVLEQTREQFHYAEPISSAVRTDIFGDVEY